MAEPERFVVIDGRRWRATDPAVPELLRAELVRALMAARRAVAAAGRQGSAEDVRRARAGVQDAKVALGERGEPWWEEPTEDGRRARVAAAIRALARGRGSGKTICPSDAARAVGGEGWRAVVPVAQEEAGRLAADGVVEITQRGTALDPGEPWRGPVRIRWVEPT